jgi:hypothetical protein
LLPITDGGQALPYPWRPLSASVMVPLWGVCLGHGHLFWALSSPKGSLFPHQLSHLQRPTCAQTWTTARPPNCWRPSCHFHRQAYILDVFGYRAPKRAQRVHHQPLYPQAIYMWNMDDGVPAVDRYMYSTDANIMAGACLGIGLSCCCVRSEHDVAYAVMCDHVQSDKPVVQACAVMALGIAYAGTRKEEVHDLLLPLIDADEAGVDVVGHTCIALGLVFAGSPNGVRCGLNTCFC